MRNCLNCSEFEDCGAVKENRFTTKRERKSFLKDDSENCKDYKEKENAKKGS